MSDDATTIREALSDCWADDAPVFAALDRLEAERDEARRELRERDGTVEVWQHAARMAEDERDGTLTALTQLRDAWNAHMDDCTATPDSAFPYPTPEEIEAWKNAPSDTASGGAS